MSDTALNRARRTAKHVSASPGPQSNEAASPPPTQTTPLPALWPAPADPLAFHRLAGAVVRLIEPHTEADPIALLVQLLVMFGNAVGRGPHCVIEAARHGLNEFAVVVGESANGRNGTSFNHVRRLFEQPASD